MANQNARISIKLTPEQSALIRKATGQEAEALELTAMELEERIAPSEISITKSLDKGSTKLF